MKRFALWLFRYAFRDELKELDMYIREHERFARTQIGLDREFLLESVETSYELLDVLQLRIH